MSSADTPANAVQRGPQSPREDGPSHWLRPGLGQSFGWRAGASALSPKSPIPVAPPRRARATYPDQELRQDHVPLAAGQVQRRAAIPLPAGLVHLITGAVCQQQDDHPQVLVGGGPQQALAQGQLGAGQRGQEQLLLVLGPDPPLLLFPARGRRGQSGMTAEAAPCASNLLTRGQARGSQAAGDKVFTSVGWPWREVCLWSTGRGASRAASARLPRNLSADSQAPDTEPRRASCVTNPTGCGCPSASSSHVIPFASSTGKPLTSLGPSGYDTGWTPQAWRSIPL